MNIARLVSVVLLVGAGSACFGGDAETAPAVSRLRPMELQPPPLPGAELRREPVSYEALPGWGEADYISGLEAFAETCLSFTPVDPRQDQYLSIPHARWARACRSAGDMFATSPDQLTVRTFFEETFEPQRLYAASNGAGSGPVTAYYEPTIEARAVQIGPFDEPILATPSDLVTRPAPDGGRVQVLQRLPSGTMRPYPERAEIVANARGNILAWGRRSDVLFLQIQGSGRLQFPDGRIVRAAYDASNGKPYVSVARELMNLGLLPPGVASNAGVKRWLDVAGSDAASAVVARNPRYIFFRLEEIDDPRQAGVGAAGVRLRARASVAIDPAHHRFGALYWIAPMGPQAPPPQLGVAQDVGEAIKGPLRGDLFFGVGEQAGDRAARVKHEAQWYWLSPRREA